MDQVTESFQFKLIISLTSSRAFLLSAVKYISVVYLSLATSFLKKYYFGFKSFQFVMIMHHTFLSDEIALNECQVVVNVLI